MTPDLQEKQVKIKSYFSPRILVFSPCGVLDFHQINDFYFFKFQLFKCSLKMLTIWIGPTSSPRGATRPRSGPSWARPNWPRTWSRSLSTPSSRPTTPPTTWTWSTRPPNPKTGKIWYAF